MPYCVALSGGIAAGKSTVVKLLRSFTATARDSISGDATGDTVSEVDASCSLTGSWGFVSADELAARVLTPGSPALRKVAERFGAQFLQTDGTLDRASLGAHVFADPGELQALNDIVHPEVGKLQEKAFARLRDAGKNVIVYEVPLLVETGKRPAYAQLIVMVSAPERERVRRLVEERGMPSLEARKRVAGQAGETTRLAIADRVIDTSISMQETARQTRKLFDYVETRAAKMRAAKQAPPRA